MGTYGVQMKGVLPWLVPWAPRARTAKTQYRKIETNILRKEIARLHSCFCERFIFLWSVCLFCCRQVGGPNVGIYRSLTNKWMWNWDWGRAIPFLGIRNSNFFAVRTRDFVSCLALMKSARYKICFSSPHTFSIYSMCPHAQQPGQAVVLGNLAVA